MIQGPLSGIGDDSLRTVIDTVFSGRAYDWVEPPRPLAWLTRTWNRLVDWIFGLREVNPVAYQWLLWGLVAVLVLVFVHGGYVLYQTIRGAGAREGGREPGAVLEVRDEAWYRGEARRHAAAGHYPEAMQAAFQSLMQRLEARGAVRTDPSRTAREYLSVVALPDDERRRLAGLVGTLYACAYAGHPCDAETYRRWDDEAFGAPWHATAH